METVLVIFIVFMAVAAGCVLFARNERKIMGDVP